MKPPYFAMALAPAACLGALLCALMAGAPSVQASHALEVLEVELGAEPTRLAVHGWQGRPALSATTRRTSPDGAELLTVHVIVLERDGLREVGRWALPPQTRHVEPLTLPGRQPGWLLLTGGQWQLAYAQGEHLLQQPLCPCDTIYSHGGTPDADAHHFAQDLDGDGIHEVVLPYSAHLEAYRIVPLLLALEPLWRVHWNADERPLKRAPKAGQGFELPPFGFADVDGNGHPDLIVEDDTALRVAKLPGADDAGGYGMDGGRRALVQRGSGDNPPPQSLMEALEALGNTRFTTADAFLNALAQQVPRESQSDWAPHLLRVMTLARSRVPVGAPYAVPLPGLGSFGEDDRGLLLGRADMDGDGVLDVLHAKLLNAGSVFKQENQLRWYRGALKDGRLSLGSPAATIRTDAGSFAMLVRPRTDDAPPLALLLATAEVSFGSIMQALASRSVTLQAQLLLWSPGALNRTPVTAKQFTYSSLKEKGRRPMFLFADLDGDGWRDYLLNLTPDVLTVFLSATGPPALDRAAFTQGKLRLPSKPERVVIADLDGDGSEELALRYRADYHGALGSRVRVLRYTVH